MSTNLHLTKFKKTNQSTTDQLRPSLRKAIRLRKDKYYVKAMRTEKVNCIRSKLKVAFMPWKGYQL